MKRLFRRRRKPLRKLVKLELDVTLFDTLINA